VSIVLLKVAFYKIGIRVTVFLGLGRRKRWSVRKLCL